MSIISELKSVDKLIPQIDKNKQKIVDQFHVDAIVVGSDWKGISKSELRCYLFRLYRLYNLYKNKK